jgi:hypothetical protein
MSRPRKKKRTPKRVLALPDLERPELGSRRPHVNVNQLKSAGFSHTQ